MLRRAQIKGEPELPIIRFSANYNISLSFFYYIFRFAYVDFATPDAKTIAITMSESHLDGRKLLIKDGEWSGPTELTSHLRS